MLVFSSRLRTGYIGVLVVQNLPLCSTLCTIVTGRGVEGSGFGVHSGMSEFTVWRTGASGIICCILISHTLSDFCFFCQTDVVP